MPDILQYAAAFNIDEKVRQTWKEVQEYYDPKISIRQVRPNTLSFKTIYASIGELPKLRRLDFGYAVNQ